MKKIRDRSIAVQNTVEAGNSYIRILHTVPTIPPIDIYLNDDLIYSNLSYGNITEYQKVPSGNVVFTLYRAGSKDDLIGIVNMNLPESNYFTLAGVGIPSKLGVVQVQDTVPTPSPSNYSFLRFYNLASDVPPLDVMLDDRQMIFQNIGFKESSQYHRISPGDYTLEFISSASGLQMFPLIDIRIDPGMLYTIYTIGYYSDEGRRQILIAPDGIYNITNV